MTGYYSAGAPNEQARVANVAARSTERPTLVPLLAWLGFVLLLVYAVMVGGGYGGIQWVTLRIVSLSIITAVLAGWALMAWRVPAWRPGTAIWPAIVIPLASFALSTALSALPRLGVEYVAWAVLLVALYLLLVRILASDFARVRIGGVAAILGTVIGLLYLGIVVGRWLEWWELLGRLAVPPLRPGYAGLAFGGPNHVATVVLLLTLIAFAGLGLATRERRIALGLLAVIAGAVVLVSGSRSAWLALAGALVAVGGLWFILDHRVMARRLRDRRTWAAVAAGAVAVVIGVIVFGPVVLDRLIASGDGGRPAYFASAVRMFHEAPVLGLGPGTWAARRIAYLEPGELDYTVPHAHNVYLQTGAELGVLGLAAGLAAAAVVVWLICRALRSSDARRRGWAWVALFGMVYLSVVSFFDFYANFPTVLVLWIIPIALLDATSDRGLGLPAALRPASVGRVAVAALALGCTVSVALLAWAESTALTNSRAIASAEAGDWEAAAVAAAETVASDASQPGHRLTLALTAMHQGDWETARDAYRVSVAVDDLPQAWLGLAMATLEAGGSADEVAGHLEAAMRIGRQHPAVSHGVGEVFDRLGMTVEADSAYAEALLQLPTLATDPSWRSTPARAERFDALLNMAIERAGRDGWHLALMAGDAQRARSLAETVVGVGDGYVTDIIDAWVGDADAVTRLEARADADPLDAGPLSTAALLAARAGRQDVADRFANLAGMTTEGPAILGLEVRTAADCDEGVRFRVASDLHGQLAWRRPTPQNLMPPGLRCLVLHDPAAW